jgi:hypothetical protein
MEMNMEHSVDDIYACVCCGYLNIREPLEGHEICKICFWQDDIFDLVFADKLCSVNRVPLVVAQRNFINFGASEREMRSFTVVPQTDNRKDVSWRTIDLSIDRFPDLQSVPQLENINGYYYWKEEYWYRNSGKMDQ